MAEWFFQEEAKEGGISTLLDYDFIFYNQISLRWIIKKRKDTYL